MNRDFEQVEKKENFSSSKTIFDFHEKSKFEPAPSNSRLDSQNLGIPYLFFKLNWSIDRLTVVGNLNFQGDYSFSDLVSVLSAHGIVERVRDGFVLRDRYGENIAFFEKLKFQNGKGRFDFNPNRLGAYQGDDLRKIINFLFSRMHFSRLDVACDIINVDNDLMCSYDVLESVSKKVFYGQDRRIETIYWGSRASKRQIRLYDKFREQKTKGQYIDKDFYTWWRLELQLRGIKTDEFEFQIRDMLENFSSVNFFDSVSVNDGMMLTALVSNPNFWSQISKNSKTKYRNMIKNISKFDPLKQNLFESFKEQLPKIISEFYYWRDNFNDL